MSLIRAYKIKKEMSGETFRKFENLIEDNRLHLGRHLLMYQVLDRLSQSDGQIPPMRTTTAMELRQSGVKDDMIYILCCINFDRKDYGSFLIMFFFCLSVVRRCVFLLLPLLWFFLFFSFKIFCEMTIRNYPIASTWTTLFIMVILFTVTTTLSPCWICICLLFCRCWRLLYGVFRVIHCYSISSNGWQTKGTSILLTDDIDGHSIVICSVMC